MRALTEHEAKVVQEFKMERTKPSGGRVGKGITFTIRVLAYADGKVFIRDGHVGAFDPEPYGPLGDPDALYVALRERAVKLAQEQDVTPNA